MIKSYLRLSISSIKDYRFTYLIQKTDFGYLILIWTLLKHLIFIIVLIKLLDKIINHSSEPETKSKKYENNRYYYNAS